MADTLDVVLRIRRITLDDARRELAAVLHAEEAARLRADEAEALIEAEAEIAKTTSSDDQDVEAFAAWLPIGRAKAAAARADHERLCSEVARARVAVNLARAAAESVQDLLDERSADRAAEASRSAQAELDDFATLAFDRVRFSGDFKH